MRERYKRTRVVIAEGPYDASHGCGGCGCLFLLTGLVLALIGAAAGAGCSARIPLTDAKAVGGIAIGHEDYIQQAVPWYISTQLSNTSNPIDEAVRFKIGSFVGFNRFFVGTGTQSPDFDAQVRIANK